MHILREALPVLCLLCALPAQAFAARDYYLSARGDDANSGASPDAAWRTIDRLNLVSFQPGDRILLEGGTTFSGNLRLTADDVGLPTAPIVVTTHGTERATIDAGAGTAIQIYNTAGLRIANLAVVGAGPAINAGSGVSAYTDLPGDVKLRFIHIERVNASGFGSRGIEIGGNNGTSGFQDVTIEFAAAWSNRGDGIMTYGPAPGTHRNVYVGYSKSFGNPGFNSARSTGNGIVLGGVDGGIVERSVAHHNGADAEGPHGPVGIWTYYSNAVTIQHNESYENRTSGGVDGGGFGLDVGVTNSTLQYNYSHGNDGAGLLLAGGSDARENAGNAIRYNISQDDGRRNGYGAIEIWGGTRNTHVYNNTVITRADSALESRVLSVNNDHAAGHYPVNVSVRNNILYAAGGIPNVHVTAAVLVGGSLRFEHNNYYSSAGGPLVIWGNATHTSLAEWAIATGQERSQGAVLGSAVNPLLTSPGGARTLDDATSLGTLTEYTLSVESPLVDAGADLSALGVSGLRDFFGMPVPAAGAFDVGACEQPATNDPSTPPEIVFQASDVTTAAGNWRLVTDPAAAGGARLQSADLRPESWPSPSAAPADYLEVTFDAPAHTRYRLWLRLRAENDSKYNDSVYVQFSDALSAGGAPVYRIGTTEGLTAKLGACSTCPPQGWGWTNSAYWLPDAGEVWFATSGPHTLRIQIRGDGVGLDQIVLSPARYLDSAPGPLRNDTVIVPKPGGLTPAAPAEIVFHASDVTTAAGNWRLVTDPAAAGGARLQSADIRPDSWPAPSAVPADYLEVAFDAPAATRYRLWLRLRAEDDSKYNDSVYVQFSDASSAGGAPAYRIGTTAGLTAKLGTCSTCPPQGWGWTNSAYWLSDTGEVWFATTGPHTMRIQIRGDGVALDQIVLSPARFADSAPGPIRNDTVIVPKS